MLSMSWLPLALIVGLLGALAVAVRRRHRVSSDEEDQIDVGTVSESWLAEQRGKKTS